MVDGGSESFQNLSNQINHFMAKIKATRNGDVREFEEVIWNNMPEGKYGWAKTAETPEAVKKILENRGQPASGQVITPQEPANPPAIPPAVSEETVSAEIPEQKTELVVENSAAKEDPAFSGTPEAKTAETPEAAAGKNRKKSS